MRTSLLISAVSGILLLSMVLVNGINAQDNLSTSENDYNLFGKVTDAKTSDPVIAQILIHGGPENSFRYELKADREGVFKASVPPGEIYLLLEAEGYVSMKERVLVPEDGPVRMQFSMEKIQKDREPNLFGMMVSQEGKGVPGVISFRMENQDEITIRSDLEGNFKAFLSPGTHIWYAEAEGFEPQRGEVTVPTGEPAKLMIRMLPVNKEVRMGILAGKVMNGGGDPIPNTEIMIFRLEDRLESDSYPGKEFWIKTDERGSFKSELPFGAYHLEAHHAGFLPFFKEFKILRDDPYVEMKIVLEKEETPQNIKVHMEYIDRNSDGFPEKVNITADVDGDEAPDILIEIIDRDSDGNPESVIFDVDLPADRMTEMLFLVLEKASQMPPFNDMGSTDPFLPHQTDDEGWLPDDPAGEEIPPVPGEEYKEDNGKAEDADDASILLSDEGKTVDDSQSSKKGTGSDTVDDLPIMIASAAIILAIVSFVVLAGYAIRFRKEN
jgi:hypothetical protein